jgi:hypothetical protein
MEFFGNVGNFLHIFDDLSVMQQQLFGEPLARLIGFI